MAYKDREKRNANARKRYAAHREAMHARDKVYYAAHRDERCLYQKKRRAQKPPPSDEEREATRLYNQQYRLANLERLRAADKGRRALKNTQARKRYADNPPDRAKENARLRALYAVKPESWRAAERRRNARKRGAPRYDLSAAQIKEILIVKGFRCDYCGRKMQRLEIEHITPIIKGGSHTLWNVTVACRTCNAKKGTNGPLRPVQPLLLTIAPSKKKGS
jgi:5-methylcytosine-specific restriction endonuclease McrA